MICFSFNIGCSESKVIFKRRKKANMSNKNALQGANVRTSCTSLRTPGTKKHSQRTESPPWACGKGCAEACAERFSALKLETGFNTFILLPNRGRVRSIWEITGLQSGRSLVLYLGWENYSGYEYNWRKKLLPFRYKRLGALVTTKKCYSRLREGDV